MGRRARRAVVLASCALWVAPVIVRAQWTTYQGDARHTGHVAATYDPSTFTLKYAVTVTEPRWLQQVSVAGGRVFVPKSFGPGENHVTQFYALDENTGATLWSKRFYDSVDPSAGIIAMSGAAYAGGNVYLQTANGVSDSYLWGFDAATGTQVLKAAHFDHAGDYPAPTLFAGAAYINANLGSLESYDLATGVRNWRKTDGNFSGFTPAVDATHVYHYDGAHFNVYDRATGASQTALFDTNWSSADVASSPAPVLGDMNDLIAIAVKGNATPDRLVSFDTTTRQVRWSKTGMNFEILQPTVANGQVITSTGAQFQVRDELSGDLLWTFDRPANETGSFRRNIVATDNLLFCSADLYTWAVDRTTHQTVWSYPLVGHLTISDDILFIAGIDSQLVAIQLPEPGMGTAVMCAVGVAILRRGRVLRSA